MFGSIGIEVRSKGQCHGAQTQQFSALHQGTCRKLHRHCAHRPAVSSPGPARFSGALVTFEPGARSAWHTHPCGQTLIVTAGLGWTQCEGEAKADPSRRCRHLPGKQETLARRDSNNRDVAHRHSGIQGRQGSRVAREGHRRTISRLKELPPRTIKVTIMKKKKSSSSSVPAKSAKRSRAVSASANMCCLPTNARTTPRRRLRFSEMPVTT